jgi:hypothetical protein
MWKLAVNKKLLPHVMQSMKELATNNQPQQGLKEAIFI